MEEFHYLKQTDGFLLGVDEVGRGPLAGPVVTASVLIESPSLSAHIAHINEALEGLKTLGIHDSKKLSARKHQKVLDQFPYDLKEMVSHRSYLLKEQNGWRMWLRIAQLEAFEIDRVNILQASLMGMRRSALELHGDVFRERKVGGEILIDGHKEFSVDRPLRASAVVKGDQKSLLIGLASIYAKQFRDALMEDYAQKYPGYGFEEHAGYPTAKHREAIERLGPCAIHRRSFKGVREFCSS